MADVRIVSGGQNQGPIVSAEVRDLGRARVLLFAQVNISGDIINPGGGGGVTSVNLSQINGVTPSVGLGAIDSGTLRIVVASDNVIQTTQPVTGAQIVGGSVGAQVTPSGDFPVRIASATAPIGVTGDVSTKPAAGQTWSVNQQNPIGVNIIGGSIGGRFSSSGDTILVSQQGVIGVQVIGGGTFGVTGDVRVKQTGGWVVSISGDSASPINVKANQQGGWATSISGDVLLRANPGTVIGQLGATVGVQIIGGSIGARISASGDLNVIPSTTNFARFPVSGDGATVDGSNPAIRATVKQYTRSNPIAVVLVNASGDAYNASGGGASSNVNINQINGQTPDIGTGNAGVGTLRVVLASDQPAVTVNATITPSPTPVTGVQVVGGSVGGRVSISGDSLGVVQLGGWAIAITGDVLLRANVGTEIGNVRIPTVLGVQVVGGGINRVSISGDSIAVFQQGAFAVSITGDVLLRANPATVIGQLGGTVGVNVVGGSVGGRFGQSGDFTVREQSVLGVQVVGGSIGAQISASGDLPVKPQAGLTKFPVSGDTRVIDGADPTIKATVKSYTRSNPQAVILVNASGDAYNSATDQPTAVALAGRITSAGSNTIVAAVAGKVIKVVSYSLQGDGNNSRGFFAAGASGSQLSLEWELAVREGVAKQIGMENSQCLFKTGAGQLLSFEMSSSQPMKYEITYHAEDVI